MNATPALCARPDCARPAKVRGFCKSHYVREMQTGRLRRRTPDERFWRKVDATGCCWEWTGASVNGYGQFSVAGQMIRVHRYAWETLVGPIPDGLELDHLCRNTMCVNPDHLEPVTPRENTLRGHGPSAINARKRLCLRGHNDWDNRPDGTRACKTCRRGYIRRPAAGRAA